MNIITRFQDPLVILDKDTPRVVVPDAFAIPSPVEMIQNLTAAMIGDRRSKFNVVIMNMTTATGEAKPIIGSHGEAFGELRPSSPDYREEFGDAFAGTLILNILSEERQQIISFVINTIIPGQCPSATQIMENFVPHFRKMIGLEPIQSITPEATTTSPE